MAWLKWIEIHKDFWLVVAALVAPFAAVFVAMVSSRRQAQALLEAIRMQIRAAAFREYRQRNNEKLREELAAEIFYVSELRFNQQKMGLGHPDVIREVKAAEARKMRIGLLVKAGAERWKKCFALENELVERFRGTQPGETWGEEENRRFDREIDALGTLSFSVVQSEVEAALEEE